MKRRSKPRNHLVLEDWVNYLKKKYKVEDSGGKRVKVLEKEDQQDVIRLAEMAWEHGSKERRHTVHSREGRIVDAYTHQELDTLFGRSQFKHLNSRVKMFEVFPEAFSEGSQGSCRGYQMTQQMVTTLKQFRKSSAPHQAAPRRLLDGSGRKVDALPQAIDPKRDDGSTARLWSGVSITNVVPVDLDLLYKAIAHYQRELSSLNRSLFTDSQTDRKKIERIIDDATAIALLSDTESGGFGLFPMRYTEIGSGRLYAKSENLQNCVREVRKIALSGLWDLDVVNCHYTLLAQMAADHGMQCPKIDRYVSNTEQVRQRLIIDTKLSRKAVKEGLLMQIYGAPRTSRPYGSLAEAAGGSKQAQALLHHELFAAIADETVRARKLLVDHAKRSARSGSIMNVAGCGLKLSNKPNPREILSHLLLGAEALLLKEAVVWLEAQCLGNVVLLQHDGMTVKDQPDVKALEAHLEDKTGFSVRFKVEQLQPPTEGF